MNSKDWFSDWYFGKSSSSQWTTSIDLTATCPRHWLLLFFRVPETRRAWAQMVSTCHRKIRITNSMEFFLLPVCATLGCRQLLRHANYAIRPETPITTTTATNIFCCCSCCWWRWLVVVLVLVVVVMIDRTSEAGEQFLRFALCSTFIAIAITYSCCCCSCCRHSVTITNCCCNT